MKPLRRLFWNPNELHKTQRVTERHDHLIATCEYRYSLSNIITLDRIDATLWEREREREIKILQVNAPFTIRIRAIPEVTDITPVKAIVNCILCSYETLIPKLLYSCNLIISIIRNICNWWMIKMIKLNF